MTEFVVQMALIQGTNRKIEHRKMVIETEDSKTRFIVPFAPRAVQMGALANNWAQIERPGRQALLQKAGPLLKTQGFSLFLGSRDQQLNIEPQLETLVDIAKSAKRVRVTYGRFESGLWRITGLSWTSELRSRTTNYITRATVEVELTEASDAGKATGPVTGGINNKSGSKSTADKPAIRYYTYRKGDTLSKLAVKFYHDASKWKRIADANKIKDPKKIKVGQRLKIP